MNEYGLSAEAEHLNPNEDTHDAARWRPLILAVLSLALVLRLVAAVVLERHLHEAGRTFFIEGDANGYWDLGKAIAAGEDYSIHQPSRHVLRVPGFPLLLAGCIQSFGDNIFPARCVLAVVGVGCCWLTWLLGSRLVMRRVGFWAALFMAVHPLQIGNSVLILSENWFTFWMLASLLALVNLMDAPGRIIPQNWQPGVGMIGRSVLTGGLIAAGVLVRPVFIPWLVVTVLTVLLLLRQSLSTRFKLSAIIVLVFGTVMLPWAARNHSMTGHWILTSLWSGPSLYDGLNPDADGSSDMEFFDRQNVMASMTEYEMNAHYQHLAMEFVRAHPSRTLSLAGRKLIRFLRPIPSFISAHWVIWVVCGAASGVFLALCVVGIRSGLLDPVGLILVLGPFLLFMVVHMVFVGSLRYRLPAEFPLAVLAATGLRQMLPGSKRG